MCSKRCKHSFKDRIPTCGLERKTHATQIPIAACMLQKDDSVDCDKCRPPNGVREHICLCKPDQSGSTHSSQLETSTIAEESQSPQQQSSVEFRQSTEYTNGEPPNGNVSRENTNNQASNTNYKQEKFSPAHIRYMDEWEAMGVMLATNGRVWGLEDKGFARQYKAALSAVNTKFEEEAANMAGHSAY
ncbi:uncharacterized protein LOC105214073 [Zeugodacus cucurbitae]|uniref:uncharacterized protein LOC105214073 n=1 Tax=Zeugodacus cucurbitae TaxID=28588 RepID=UPI00059692D6|nr:uncharacterized protein LOC105214073 [Zeugodacus cucurbitae]